MENDMLLTKAHKKEVRGQLTQERHIVQGTKLKYNLISIKYSTDMIKRNNPSFHQAYLSKRKKQ